MKSSYLVGQLSWLIILHIDDNRNFLMKVVESRESEKNIN